MKLAVVASICVLLVTGCADTLWHVSQASPGLARVSDRMNDRALRGRLSGDPLKELDWNIALGDYRFRGLLDFNAKREWVPGISAKAVPAGHVEYLVTDHTQTWTPQAESYFSLYNRALLPRWVGRQLDKFGTAIR